MKIYSIFSIGLSIFFLSGCNLTTNTVGVGHISSADGNISCGWYHTTCSHSYESGESATLSAEAAPFYEFIGWEGGCSGKDDCTVSLNQARTVTAVFEPQSNVTIPIEELAFNDATLKACVDFAVEREEWIFNTDVTTLECKAQSLFASDHGVSITNLEGMQLFPNLSQLILRQRCYISGPLIGDLTCEGPTPTDFTALSLLPLESLVIEGGWYQRSPLFVKGSQYRINAFPELSYLTNLEITGLVSAKVPDISNLDMLETYKVGQTGDGFISLGSIIDGAGQNLRELTTSTENLPCSEIDLAFLSHTNLLINGKTEANVHQCED